MSKKAKTKHKLLLPFLSKKAVVIITTVLLFVSLLIILQSGQRQDFYGRSQVNDRNAECDILYLQLSSEERVLFDMINQYRQANGLSVLGVSSAMMRTAKWLSLDMSTSGNLTHIDTKGRDFTARRLACGATTYGQENIAQTTDGAQAVFTTWKNSADHNAAMLDATIQVMGIGTSKGYWVLETGFEQTITDIPTSAPGEAGIPSPQCLGTCPTAGVPNATTPTSGIPNTTAVPTSGSNTPLTPAPTTPPDEGNPNENDNPGDGDTPDDSTDPDDNETPNEEENPEQSPPSQNGFLQFFLGFLLLILQFFLSLFGR